LLFRFRSPVVAMLVIKIDKNVPMKPISREKNKNNEVRNQQRQVESVDLIEPLKCLIEEVLPYVRHDPAGCGKYSEDVTCDVRTVQRGTPHSGVTTINHYCTRRIISA